MLKTTSGAPDGLTVCLYEEGKTYPNDKVELSEELYDVFVNQIKVAQDYEKPASFVRKEQKFVRKMEPAPKNKAIAAAPSNKVTKKDFKELGAGQVRKLAKKHGVDLKDKPFNTSAKNLIETFFQRYK